MVNRVASCTFLSGKVQLQHPQVNTRFMAWWTPMWRRTVSWAETTSSHPLAKIFVEHYTRSTWNFCVAELAVLVVAVEVETMSIKGCCMAKRLSTVTTKKFTYKHALFFLSLFINTQKQSYCLLAAFRGWSIPFHMQASRPGERG